MKTLITILLASLLWSCELIIEPVIYSGRGSSTYSLSGTYYMSEYSETYRYTTSYQITVTRYGSTVYIDNFYGEGITVTGTLTGNRIDIARQYRGSYEIQGVAYVETNGLSMTYSVRDTYNRTTDFCNSTADRTGY